MSTEGMILLLILAILMFGRGAVTGFFSTIFGVVIGVVILLALLLFLGKIFELLDRYVIQPVNKFFSPVVKTFDNTVDRWDKWYSHLTPLKRYGVVAGITVALSFSFMAVIGLVIGLMTLFQ